MRFYEVGGGGGEAVHLHRRLHHRLLDHDDYLGDQQSNEVGDGDETILTQALVHPSPPELSWLGMVMLLGLWLGGSTRSTRVE